MGAPGRSVWVFLGDRAHWPSGVLSSGGAAVRWIIGHHLTGMFTGYPVNAGV